MKLKLLIITIMSSCCFAYGFGETIKEPCDYIDTVNITSGQMDENGNIKFNGTIFPKETYAQYNYEIVNYAERKSVNQHTRGCICLIKPCIRLCCYKNPTNSIAIPCVSEDTFSVQNIDGNVQNVNLNDGNFGVVLGKPCLMMFLVDNQEHSDENWHLHKVSSTNFLNDMSLTFSF